MHRALGYLPHESSVLALGCDQAFLSAQLAEYAANVMVLDTSAAQIAMLSPRFPEISFRQYHPAGPLPFANDSVDAIWCCDFLDRVFNPITALSELHRVLRPGGKLCVTVPDHGRPRNPFATVVRCEQAVAAANPRIRHFTRAMLQRVATVAGFRGITVALGTRSRRATGILPRTLLLSARKPVLAVTSGKSVSDRGPRGRK